MHNPTGRKQKRLGIIGATGLVGNEISVLLDQRRRCFSEIALFASKDSEGEIYKVGDEELVVHAMTEESLDNIDLIIFAATPEVAKLYLPKALERGVVVIDCSGALDAPSPTKPGQASSVPVVVPEVNAHALSSSAKQVANPSPAVVQLTRVLKVIHDVAGLESVDLTSLHSTSGAGKAALDELWQQTLAVFNQTAVETEEFGHQIAFNCIPQVDVMTEDGFTREEHRIVAETSRVLGLPDLRLSVTCVRIPVLYGYVQSVNLTTERTTTVDAVLEALQAQSDIRVYPDSSDYPMPLTVVGSDEVHVGRVRAQPGRTNGISLWIAADNVRRGVALNSLRIAELLSEEFSQ